MLETKTINVEKPQDGKVLVEFIVATPDFEVGDKKRLPVILANELEAQGLATIVASQAVDVEVTPTPKEVNKEVKLDGLSLKELRELYPKIKATSVAKFLEKIKDANS